MSMTTLDTAAATVRAVCTPYPEISPSKVDLVSEIIQNDQLTDEQIGRVREIVRDQNAALEPPMPVAEAACLLGISRAALPSVMFLTCIQHLYGLFSFMVSHPR